MAAAAAFRKVTGVDASSNRRIKLLPEDGPVPDEFEMEFLDEVFLPDPARARAEWARMEPAFARGTRFAHRRNLTRPAAPDDFASLDLESQVDGHLRSRFTGAWNGTAGHLEKFLQEA